MIFFSFMTLLVLVLVYLIVRAFWVYNTLTAWVDMVYERNTKLFLEKRFDEFKQDDFGYTLLPNFDTMLYSLNWDPTSFLSDQAKTRIGLVAQGTKAVTSNITNVGSNPTEPSMDYVSALRDVEVVELLCGLIRDMRSTLTQLARGPPVEDMITYEQILDLRNQI